MKVNEVYNIASHHPNEELTRLNTSFDLICKRLEFCKMAVTYFGILPMVIH